MVDGDGAQLLLPRENTVNLRMVSAIRVKIAFSVSTSTYRYLSRYQKHTHAKLFLHLNGPKLHGFFLDDLIGRFHRF